MPQPTDPNVPDIDDDSSNEDEDQNHNLEQDLLEENAVVPASPTFDPDEFGSYPWGDAPGVPQSPQPITQPPTPLTTQNQLQPNVPEGSFNIGSSPVTSPAQNQNQIDQNNQNNNNRISKKNSPER